MASKQLQVILEPTVIRDEAGLMLSVAVANRSNGPVTIATLPRYLAIELKDARGQFVRGRQTESALGFPAADDYITIEKSTVKADLFRLPITAQMVGSLEFGNVPRANVIRVTYKADKIMPNLPSKSRKNFFEGPTEPKSTAVQLP